MTNSEVTNYLKDCQRFWSRWKDKPIKMHGCLEEWEQIVQEANEISERNKDTAMIMFFLEQLEQRAKEREQNGNADV